MPPSGNYRIYAGGFLDFAGGARSGGANQVSPAGEVLNVLPTGIVAGDGQTGGVLETISEDGRFLAVGGFVAPYAGMARFLSSGALDATFADPLITGTIRAGEKTHVARALKQGTGYLIIGNFTSAGGVACNGFARVNGDGTVDAAWSIANTGQPSAIAVVGARAFVVADNTIYAADAAGAAGYSGPTFSAPVESMLPAAGGKLIVAGDFNYIDSLVRNGPARLSTASATGDHSFPDLGVDGNVLDMCAHAGKIYAAGDFTSANGAPQSRVICIAADGTIDTSFSPVTINNTVSAIAAQSDGKLVIGGNFTTVGGTTRTRLARLNTNGTLDTTFTPGSTNGNVERIRIQPDGKILVSGAFSTLSAKAALRFGRLLATGVRDETYAPAGPTGGAFKSFVMQSDGKAVVYGAHNGLLGPTVNGLTLMPAGGGAPAGFNGFANSAQVTSAVVLDGGKVLVAGNFVTFGGMAYEGICRLTADFQLDTTYPTGVQPRGMKLTKLTNGKLVGFAYINGWNRTYMFNADGTPDTSHVTLQFSSGINGICAVGGGKFYVYGSAYEINTSRVNLVLCNAAGAIDTSVPDIGCNAAVMKCWRLADDSIIATSTTNAITVGGVSRTYAFKVGADRLLSSHDMKVSSYLNDLVELSSGKIVICGNFSSLNGVAQTRVARLNADLTRDSTFVNNATITPAVLAVHVQASGAVVYMHQTQYSSVKRLTATGGNDSSFTNVAHSQFPNFMAGNPDGSTFFMTREYLLHRILPDGGLDTSFNQNVVAGSEITELIPNADRTLFLVLGAFTSGAPQPYGGITRFNLDGSVDTGYPGYTGSSITFETVDIDASDNLMISRSGVLEKRTPAGVVTAIAGFADRNPRMSADGYIYTHTGYGSGDVYRITPAGVEDTAYGRVAYSDAQGLLPDPRGAGAMLMPQYWSAPVVLGGAPVSKVGRLNANGSRDATWVGADNSYAHDNYRLFDAGGGKIYRAATEASTCFVRRLLPDGELDSAWPTEVRFRPDSSIVIDPADFSLTGFAEGSGSSLGFTRYNGAGVTDSGFPGLNFLNGTRSPVLKLLGDGRLLVAGDFDSVRYNLDRPVSRAGLVMVGVNGALDPTFRNAPLVNGAPTGVSLAPNGDIAITGPTVSNVLPTSAMFSTRSATGGLDRTFTADPYINPSATIGGAKPVIGAIAPLQDGRMYVAGQFATYGGSIVNGAGGLSRSSLMRLLPDGSLDDAFADPQLENTKSPPAGQVSFPPMIDAMAVQGDGSVIVVGIFDRVGVQFSRENIARFLDNGELDTAYWVRLSGGAHAIALQPDGKAVVGGIFAGYKTGPLGSETTVPMGGVIRINADGTVDSTFSDPQLNVGSFGNTVKGIALQPDGKIIVVGSFNKVGAASVPSCIRLNSDGTLDAGFAADITGQVQCVALDAEQRVILGGSGGVIRLLNSGAADASWTNPFTGVVGGATILGMKVLPDGKCAVAGEFDLQGRQCLAIIGADGGLDASFLGEPALRRVSSGLVRAQLLTVAVNPEPALVMFPDSPPRVTYQSRALSIRYRTFGGMEPYTHEVIGKLPDGLARNGEAIEGAPLTSGVAYWRVRVTDAAGTTADIVTRLAIAPLLAPSRLLSFGAAGVHRMQPDGSGSTLVTATNTEIVCAVRTRDGKILIGGSFTTVGGQARAKIARLNADGTFDASFDPGSRVPGEVVEKILVRSDGRLLVLSNYPYSPITGSITALLANGAADTSFTLDARVKLTAAYTAKELPNGDLLIGGASAPSARASLGGALVFKLTASGALVESFINTFFPAWNGGDGSAVAGVFNDSPRMFDIRGGSFSGIRPSGVYEILVEPTRLVLCGAFIRMQFGGVVAESVTSIGLDGSASSSFVALVKSTDNSADVSKRAIVRNIHYDITSDAYVVSGRFDMAHNQELASGYTRLLDGGGFLAPPAPTDAGFNVDATVQLPDGRFMTGARHNTVQTNERLFPDGTRDTSFVSPQKAAAYLVDDLGSPGFVADGTIAAAVSGTEFLVPPLSFDTDGAIILLPEASPMAIASDCISMNGLPSPLGMFRAGSVLGIGELGESVASGTSTATSTLRFGDALAVVFRVLISEGVTFGASAAGNHQAVASAIDRLLLEGHAASVADAASMAVAGLAFGALSESLALAAAKDTIALQPDVASTVEAMERLVDEALFRATDSSTFIGMALVEESVRFDSEAITAAEMRALVSESIGFAVSVHLDSGDYTAWVLNTESRGLSRYTQYPFNSFAKIGNRYYGASGAGVFRLEGDTDSGAPIAARLRLGLSDMGSRALKRMPEAFVGYRSDGTLLLRVISIDDATGAKQAAVYRLAPRGAASVREGRFKMGRGVKSVDWAFELENVDGSDFELESIEFRPIRLDRRTRG